VIDNVQKIRGDPIPYVLQKIQYGSEKTRLGQYVEIEESVYDHTYLLHLNLQTLIAFMDI